jgi:catechol 2,3-dioxygenase-like lactoylglutathione lyase family enzyme
MSNPVMQVNLLVQDVKESVRFYRDVLRFHFQGFWDPVSRTAVQEWGGPDKPGYAELRVGTARVGLRPAPDDAKPSGHVELAVHVDEAELHHARIEAAQAHPTHIARQPWGGVTFSVTDPDGFRWEIVEMKGPC